MGKKLADILREPETRNLFENSPLAGLTLSEILHRTNTKGLNKCSKAVDMNMSVKAFYQEIMKSVSPNKPFLTALDEISTILYEYSGMSDEELSALEPKIEQEQSILSTEKRDVLSVEERKILSEIRTDALSSFMEDFDKDSLKKAKGIKFLIKLYDFSLKRTNPNSKQEKRDKAIASAVDYVRGHYSDIIKVWNEAHTAVTLPLNYDETLSIQDAIIQCIKDIGVAAEKINRNPFKGDVVNSKYYDIIKAILLNEGTKDDVAEKYHVKKQSCEGDFMNFITDFSIGKVYKGIKMDERLYVRIQDFKESQMFHEETEEKLSDNVLRYFMEFDVCDIGGKRFFIPLKTKGEAQVLGNQFLRDLKDAVIPTDGEELKRKSMNSYNYRFQSERRLSDEEKEALLDNILDSDLVETTEDGMYQINFSKLDTREQKILRAMYLIWQEKKMGFSKNEIQDRLNQLALKYHSIDEINADPIPKKARDLGFQANGVTWIYGEGTGVSKRQFIKDYAEEHKIFYLSEISDCLKQNMYSTDERTLRAYILNFCLKDLDDGNHFCLESEVENHRNFRWAKRREHENR